VTGELSLQPGGEGGEGAERRARSGTRSTLVRSATSALREVILASVDSFFSMASSLHMGKRAC
jgi:hypothetical protein